MYQITRQEAANVLNISTRTLDRYIRSKKLRSKKIWKQVFLSDEDVEKLKNWWLQEDYEIIDNIRTETISQEIIIPEKEEKVSYRRLYEQVRSDLEKKNKLIEELSYNLGKTQKELENSISMLDFKKTTFLLESSKNKIEEEKKLLINEIENLEVVIESNKKNTILLICLVFVLLVVSALIWFIRI